MVAEAWRDPVWDVLRSIPFLGPVRVALLLATLKTPWRFRTKRNLWSYGGLAVVTESSADREWIRGQAVRRRRPPLTRGLNPNHNRIVKEVFKGAATAATGRPGALRDFYQAMVARGMRPEMARLTLARKLAALTLQLWKTSERYDAAKLTVQSSWPGEPRVSGAGDVPSPQLRLPGRGREGQSQPRRSPGRQSRRGTQLTAGPSQNPKKRQAGVCRVSDRTMVRVVRPPRFATSNGPGAANEENDAEKD